MTYRTNEGPPPFRTGERNVTFITDSDTVDLVLPESETIFRNRLVLSLIHI